MVFCIIDLYNFKNNIHIYIYNNYHQTLGVGIYNFENGNSLNLETIINKSIRNFKLKDKIFEICQDIKDNPTNVAPIMVIGAINIDANKLVNKKYVPIKLNV